MKFQLISLYFYQNWDYILLKVFSLGHLPNFHNYHFHFINFMKKNI